MPPKKLIEPLETDVPLVQPAAPCELSREVFGPHGSRPTDRLDERVRSGDACAALDLGVLLLRRVGRPEDYRRAYTLLRSARRVGVELPDFSCVLFDLAGDIEGLRICLDDLRSRWIAEHPNELDGSAFVLEQFCARAGAATTSLEMMRCESDALITSDVVQSAQRAAAMTRLAEDEELGLLQMAFAEYCDAETDRRGASFVGGSGFISGMCALALEGAIHATHDDVLLYLAELDQPVDATQATAQDVVRAELEARDRALLETIAVIHGVEQRREYERLLTLSQVRFREYERAVWAAATRRLGAPRSRAIRSVLRSLRISALGSCPG
ncbi:MAG: hypothetical protein KC731_42240 [Myxococcales bacterium]|nr:hypothetical protein [Myxococcales bacterium]